MLGIIEKSLNNTVDIFIFVFVVGIFVVGFVLWLYIPFVFISIHKELKKIREILEKLGSIKID